MSSFTDKLTVTKIGERTWSVERTFTYFIGEESSNEFITIPKGFVTDFASIPRVFWVILPPDGEYTQAAVLHDYMCSTSMFPMKKIDKIFLEAMVVLKVPAWKRNTIYWAVRIWHMF